MMQLRIVILIVWPRAWTIGCGRAAMSSSPRRYTTAPSSSKATSSTFSPESSFKCHHLTSSPAPRAKSMAAIAMSVRLRFSSNREEEAN
ncbi:hypothetical protein Q3G72_014694 [Acer saccharum]|nr:hypothetical protein Q3G72_014694 [Acer saccharum]